MNKMFVYILCMCLLLTAISIVSASDTNETMLDGDGLMDFNDNDTTNLTANQTIDNKTNDNMGNLTINNNVDDEDSNTMTYIYLGCLGLVFIIILICIYKKYKKPKLSDQEIKDRISEVEPEKVDNSIHPPK